MTEDMTMENDERKGFLAWLKGKFSKGEEEEEPHYRRKLLDGRIERFLDQSFNTYIQEYGIITGLDLESYEERYEDLTTKIGTMREYVLEADAKVSGLEMDISLVKAEAKKMKKK